MSTMSPTATEPATTGPSAGWIRWIAACAHAYVAYWDRRTAIKALQELDDRALRDIGLARCHIDAAVGGALNPDMARFR
jgi:uncharacterized protein YjiS (DUF1127 family)